MARDLKRRTNFGGRTLMGIFDAYYCFFGRIKKDHKLDKE